MGDPNLWCLQRHRHRKHSCCSVFGYRVVGTCLIAEQWDRIGQFYAAFPAGARHGVGRPAAAQPLPGVEPLLRRQPRARTRAEDQTRAAVHVRAAAAGQGAAGPAQGRAAPRPGAGCLLLAAAPDFPFDADLLRHVSPIEWKNVILYGEIKIDPAKLKTRGA